MEGALPATKGARGVPFWAIYNTSFIVDVKILGWHSHAVMYFVFPFHS